MTTNMSTTNYHNEAVTFTLGQTVIHVTDGGEMVAATIIGFSGRMIELAFADSDHGSELAASCF